MDLGEGRVLVDKGCPDFIRKLRECGVKVIETVVPVGELIHGGGWLRCFFNEVLP